MAKGKGFPIKQIFFNHFEKMLFGICLVLAIWMLTQNQWFGIRETPAAMETSAKAAEKVYEQSTFPESERKNLTLNDYQELAKKIPQKANGELYAVSEPFFWELNPKKVPASEPKWLGVEDLIADADRAILALKGAGVPVAAVESATGTPSGIPMETLPLKPDPMGDPMNLPGLGEIAPDFKPGAAGVGQPGSPLDVRSLASAFSGIRGRGLGGRRRRDEEDGEDGDRARVGATTTAAPSREVKGDDGQGYRYASIRGVYPWKKQLMELVDSKTFESLVQADDPEKFSLVDFQIERREAIPGVDPWGGAWEKIDVEEVQKFLLEKSFNFDPDPVDPVDTDPAITMPIPMRAFGGWPKAQVTHPRIKSLDAKAMEMSLKQQEELLKNQAALKKEEETSRKKKGFSSVVRDVRAVRSYQSSGGGYDEEDDDRGKGGRGGGGGMRGGFGGMSIPVGPAGRGMPTGEGSSGTIIQTYMGPDLLLFRFFDLTVEPGRTYQYRVRLVVTNPNHGKTLADVMEPFVIEGETRETPWSNPSEPVEIPNDYDIFLAQIKADASQDPLGGMANFHVYEWEPSIGTFILGTGRVMFGDTIGFLVPTRVLRLHKKTANREAMQFKTSDVLLGGISAPQLIPSQHPDLELPEQTSSRPLLGILRDEAIVMNQFGEIEALDPYSRQSDLNEARKSTAATFALFEFLQKEAANATAGGGAQGNIMRREGGKE